MSKSLPKKKRPTPKPKKARVLSSGKQRLRGGLVLADGLPSINKMREEIDHMESVLMGKEDPPIQAGPMTLMEVADGYFSRASELTRRLQRLETDGVIGRGDDLYKFRTGELRTFMELAKRAADLGSRRLTYETLLFDKSKYGRESYGHDD